MYRDFVLTFFLECITGCYDELPDPRTGATQVTAEDADGLDRRPEGTGTYF